MRLVTSFSMALAIVMAPVAVGSAQTLPRTGLETVYYSTTVATLASIATAKGYVVETDTTGNGPVVRVYADQARRDARNPLFFVGLAACDLQNQPPGCLGVHLARMSTLPQSDLGKAERFAQRFHEQYSFGRVYVSNGRYLVIDYYVMLDKGVTQKHLESVVNEYVGLLDAFFKLWAEVQ